MRITTILLAMIAALALLLAACGGGGDDGDSDEATPTEAADTGADTPPDGGDDDDDGPEGAAFENVYPVNQTFWHQGFKVEIGDAIYAGTDADIFGDQDLSLTAEATFTNEGDDQSSLSSDVVLVTPGGTVNAQFGGIPNVPGGLDVSGEFIFRVDEDFEIDDAYLLIGSGGEQQARVPLGASGGELVSLEPADVPVTGTLSTSLIDLHFTSGALRADDPVNHQQVDAEKLALTLNFDVTSRKSGNWSVFAQEFVLTLPDGSSVAVDGSHIPGLPGSDAGLDTPDLYLRFLVDDPADGTYVLRFVPSDRWLSEGDPTEVTLEFDLE